MEKLLSIVLALTMVLSLASVFPVSAVGVDVEAAEPIGQDEIGIYIGEETGDDEIVDERVNNEVIESTVELIKDGTVSPMTANPGIDVKTFESRFAAFKSKHPHLSYFNDDPETWGSTCFNFANYISKCIFGTNSIARWSDGTGGDTNNYSITYGSAALDNLHIGDVVRFRTSDAYDHSIFVTYINGDNVYYVDQNSHFDRKIRYDGCASLSDLRKKIDRELNNDYTIGWVAHYKFWNEPPALKSTAKFKDNTYEYYKCSNVSWSEANAFANSKGGHLVTLTSKEENDFVSSQNTVGNYWIGATDKDTEGVWKWVTGESFAFNNWKVGEPNNLDNEDYAMCYEDGYWNDAVENWFKVTGFVVEYDVHTHTFTDDWQSDDTNHWKECSCGEKSSVAAHTWDSGNVTKPATETETGVMTYTCTVCKRTRTEDIPKLQPSANGKAILSNVTVAPGGTVDVTVSLTGFPKCSTVCISNISFNNSQLKLVSGKWDEEFKKNASISSEIEPGREEDVVIITFDSDREINGNIAKLRFEASNGADLRTETITAIVTTIEDSGATSTVNAEGTISIARYKRGDVNGDGILNNKDAIYLLKHVVLGSVYPITQDADMNGDGVVNNKDAIYLLKHVVLGDMYPLKNKF